MTNEDRNDTEQSLDVDFVEIRRLLNSGVNIHPTLISQLVWYVNELIRENGGVTEFPGLFTYPGGKHVAGSRWVPTSYGSYGFDIPGQSDVWSPSRAQSFVQRRRANASRGYQVGRVNAPVGMFQDHVGLPVLYQDHGPVEILDNGAWRKEVDTSTSDG